ncbi:fungal-specific transcription factor domain-containing protein [Thelonectria olida]|uniref:Fungal-specific transcription factor domain-containing protein n=1 Tax=Thelonectria olida TaxID=1576542 RepID=A0A9P9ASN5_9HYPO|nr:fungal-specific transcription factor domain-containing protein [Thelonectria olida]
MTPEHRQRQRRRKVTLACEPCRHRKSRCDGGKPICSTCQHRSLGLEQCIYRTSNARTACGEDYTKSLHERIRQLEQACSSQQKEVASATSTPAQAQRQSTEESSLAHGVSLSIDLGPDNGQDPTKSPSPASLNQIDAAESMSGVTAMGTMLSEDLLTGSIKESQHFFGGSSAVSFLKEACGPINSQSPSRPRAREEPVANVLSAYSNLHNFPIPPRPLADHLIQKYFERIYYLYPFFDRETFETAYQSLWQTGSQTIHNPKPNQSLGLGSAAGCGTNSIVFHCALNALFALGCTFSDLTSSEKPAAIEVFFNRSKGHVGIDLLDMNNIGVVQALLLVALALQGTPFPNRCWNAVGVACRVAQGLGLHTDVNRQHGESREKEMRRRTWYGCVTMDFMTFGRPNMTTNLPALPPTGLGGSGVPSSLDTDLKLHFNVESVRLGRVLEGILSKIYQPWLNRSPTSEASPALGSDIHHSLDNIVDLHTQLTKFEQSLPPSLSWESPASLDGFSQQDRRVLETQRNVLRARFLYLQLMLYRPILTHLLTADASRQAANEDPNRTKAPSNGLMSSFSLECAKSCIKAAMQLIDLIYVTHQTETSDMWWWNGLYACTAGLVLIFARLCSPLWNSLVESEIDKAWEQCQRILQNLASFSTLSRKSIALLRKVNEIVLAKCAAQKHGLDHLLDSQVEGQEVIPSPRAGSPEETWDHSLPFGLDFPDPNQMDMIGSVFSSWDQPLDFFSSGFY